MNSLERLYSEDVVIETKRTNDAGEEEVERRTQRRSVPFLNIVARLNPKGPSTDLLKDVVWAGLIHEDPDMTPEEAEILVSYEFTKLAYVFEQMDKAVAQTLGVDRDELMRKRAELAAEEEAGADGKNASMRGGTGKKSKNSVADSSG